MSIDQQKDGEPGLGLEEIVICHLKESLSSAISALPQLIVWGYKDALPQITVVQDQLVPMYTGPQQLSLLHSI